MKCPKCGLLLTCVYENEEIDGSDFVFRLCLACGYVEKFKKVEEDGLACGYVEKFKKVEEERLI